MRIWPLTTAVLLRQPASCNSCLEQHLSPKQEVDCIDRCVANQRSEPQPFHDKVIAGSDQAFGLTQPSCFEACGSCEMLTYSPEIGGPICVCVAHCWRGTDASMCDEPGFPGLTRDDPTVVGEEWSASCADSLVNPLPKPVVPCANMCSAFPYAAKVELAAGGAPAPAPAGSSSSYIPEREPTLSEDALRTRLPGS